MIDRARLLADLKPFVSHLEGDLRQRLADQPELEAPLREEYRLSRGRCRAPASR